MRKYFAALTVLILLTLLVSTGVIPAPVTSAQDGGSGKISGLLALQVQAKLRAQAGAPLAEGQVNILEALQEQGGTPGPVNKQRIFLYSTNRLSQVQIQELGTMGLTLYPDSWIPPVGDHPTGFILADMPLDKLSEMAGKGYVARLDTAERFLQPQNDLSNQKMNADDVWAAGWNGTGVTVAVLDSGLDTTHGDIPMPVVGKDFDDYPVIDDTIANTVTGHGTHVTGSVLGRPSDRASITAWAQGPWARSRQAANTEMPRPAARSTMLNTTRAVHRQPWSLTSLAFSKHSSVHE